MSQSICISKNVRGEIACASRKCRRGGHAGFITTRRRRTTPASEQDDGEDESPEPLPKPNFEPLLGPVRAALRADDLRVLAEDQLLEALIAGTALIFVDRHGTSYRNHR
jgi:hypothetical protein